MSFAESMLEAKVMIDPSCSAQCYLVYSISPPSYTESRSKQPIRVEICRAEEII